MRPVLVIPAGRVPDWCAAEQYIEAMSREELAALVDDATRILGQWRAVEEKVVRQRLRDGLAELRAALHHGERPTSPLHCTLLAVGDAKVLFERHPPGSPTILCTLIRLLDRAGVLDPLGCESLCEKNDKLAASDDAEGAS